MSTSQPTQIRFRILCNSDRSLLNAFNTTRSLKGAQLQLVDGAVVSVEDVSEGDAMTKKEVMITIVLSIATGIPTNLVSDKIYDEFFASPDVQQVVVQGQPKKIANAADLEHAIDNARNAG